MHIFNGFRYVLYSVVSLVALDLLGTFPYHQHVFLFLNRIVCIQKHQQKELNLEKSVHKAEKFLMYTVLHV